MGQIGNTIGNHLGLTTLWRNYFVGAFSVYKAFLHNVFVIKEICKNYFINYSIPEIIIGQPRNNKQLEQKDRNIQTNLIANIFNLNNIVYGQTTVFKEHGLLITNELLDSGLSSKKNNEEKDFKKSDSAYHKPKLWKRKLPQTIMAYVHAKTKRKSTLELFKKNKRKKPQNLIFKSFFNMFRTKYIKRRWLDIENMSRTPYEVQQMRKIFIKKNKFKIETTKENRQFYAQEEEEEEGKIMQLDLELDEIQETKIGNIKLKRIPVKEKKTNTNIFIEQHNFFICTHIGLRILALKNYFRIKASIFNLFLYQTLKNRFKPKKKIKKRLRTSKIIRSKRNKEKKKKLLGLGGKRLHMFKRYPMIYNKLFSKQTKIFETIPNHIPWNLLKSIILGFKNILNMEANKSNFWLLTLKNNLTTIITWIGFIPKAFILRVLNTTLVDELSKLIIMENKKIFMCERYLLYQTAYCALSTAISSIKINKNLRFSFVGKHTRNISAALITNYIITKLGQYFTVQEVVRPIAYDLKSSPLLNGFKIIVTGRVTRKERAAFILKHFGNLPLNKFSAKIDYAAGFKIMKFGQVGIKVFLNKINVRSSYYAFTFSC